MIIFQETQFYLVYGVFDSHNECIEELKVSFSTGDDLNRIIKDMKIKILSKDWKYIFAEKETEFMNEFDMSYIDFFCDDIKEMKLLGVTVKGSNLSKQSVVGFSYDKNVIVVHDS